MEKFLLCGIFLNCFKVSTRKMTFCAKMLLKIFWNCCLGLSELSREQVPIHKWYTWDFDKEISWILQLFWYNRHLQNATSTEAGITFTLFQRYSSFQFILKLTTLTRVTKERIKKWRLVVADVTLFLFMAKLTLLALVTKDACLTTAFIRWR